MTSQWMLSGSWAVSVLNYWFFDNFCNFFDHGSLYDGLDRFLNNPVDILDNFYGLLNDFFDISDYLDCLLNDLWFNLTVNRYKFFDFFVHNLLYFVGFVDVLNDLYRNLDYLFNLLHPDNLHRHLDNFLNLFDDNLLNRYLDKFLLNFWNGIFGRNISDALHW